MSASGIFTVTVTAPAGAAAAIYRLTGSVPATTKNNKHFPTDSLPEVAQLSA